MASVRLFNSTETDFSHNETVLNQIISCKVTEEINGDYTLELEYPLEDLKGISSGLVATSIITVPTIDNRENQLFRIIEKETTSDSIIVQAQAKLLADLKVNRMKALTITGKTRTEAIQAVLDSALESHTYTVGNLDSSTNTDVIVNAEEGNLLTSIIGDENSVLAEYGGEFVIDNDTISIVDERGSENNVIIEYGKNLSSIKETIDLTDLATVLIPKSGDYRLPEYYIESPLVGAYEKRYFQEVELNLDIWDGEDEQGDDQITEEEAYTLMRETCNKMFDDKVDQITFNYTVDFVELSKTEEYKDYAILETVALGDTVTIKHKKLNLNLEGRVNKISYTVDSEGITTIDTIEIGFTKKDITSIISDTVKSIEYTKNEITLSVNNSIKKVNATLNIQGEKISAVVQSSDDGMTWELSEDAFIVCCTGASDSNVTIDSNGLTVNNGKFLLKNDGDTVFKVNTSGVCQADGGFVVEDGDTSCEINATGVNIIGSNGYKAQLQAMTDRTGLYVVDDLYIQDVIRAYGDGKFEKDIILVNGGNIYFDKDKTKSLEDLIDERIAAHT